MPFALDLEPAPRKCVCVEDGYIYFQQRMGSRGKGFHSGHRNETTPEATAIPSANKMPSILETSHNFSSNRNSQFSEMNGRLPSSLLVKSECKTHEISQRRTLQLNSNLDVFYPVL